MTLASQIIARAKAGTPPARISADMGVSVYTVYTALRKARAAGQDVPRFHGGGMNRTTLGQELRFLIPPDIAADLVKQAQARNLRPAELCRDIITAAIEDKLIPALLNED